MNPTFVAIDIGASSGRLMKVRGMQRFFDLGRSTPVQNGFRNKDGHDRWKIDYLIKEILIGFEN